MNDWITHNFWAFWIVLIMFGVAIGYLSLASFYGVGGSLLAGALGGAGTAFILSTNRYIGGSDQEDDGPRQA